MPTFPLNLPTVTGIASIKWAKSASVIRSDGSFDLTPKVYDWGGKRWDVEVSLPPLTESQWRIWEAFFLSLNGPVGTFWLGPTLDKTASGVATGTPLINGGSQTGASVVSDGWTISTTGILKAGDWVQIGNRLHRVLADADSDGSGDCTFEVWPTLVTSPDDDDPIVVTNPKGLFRLTEMPDLTQNVEQFAEGITFQAVEAL